MDEYSVLTTFRRVRSIIKVMDGAFIGRPQFDMGNVGLVSTKHFRIRESQTTQAGCTRPRKHKYAPPYEEQRNAG